MHNKMKALHDVFFSCCLSQIFVSFVLKKDREHVSKTERFRILKCCAKFVVFKNVLLVLDFWWV